MLGHKLAIKLLNYIILPTLSACFNNLCKIWPEFEEISGAVFFLTE